MEILFSQAVKALALEPMEKPVLAPKLLPGTAEGAEEKSNRWNVANRVA